MPDEALRQRILDAARVNPVSSRQRARATAALALAATLSLSLTVFLLAGGLRQGPRPTSLVLLTSMGAALIAVASARTAWSRGGSMTGRPARILWALVFAAPVGLFLLKYGVSEAYQGMTREWTERVGWRCFGWSIAIGVLPLAALLSLRRDSALVRPRLLGAALGISVGALVWVPVDLWCPVAYAPHLLLGHVLPMVLFAVIGAIAGGAILRMRGA